MKIIQSTKKPIITVVCCVHGNEVFGLDVYNHILKNRSSFPHVKAILANEKALNRNIRFIDKNLNQVFNTPPDTSYEYYLSQKVLQESKSTKYLIDIHTTSSDIQMTPIVATLSKQNKQIINLCSSREVAYMSKSISKNSLIGTVGGTSLEFNEIYAKTSSALFETVSIINGIVEGKTRIPIKRKIYYIDSAIEKSVILPPNLKNFQLIKELNKYPFLLFEKEYKDIHCHAASRVKKMII